jgi:hypothetical protein
MRPPGPCLLRGLDHRTGQARTGVASRLGGVVVRIGVDDQAAADDVGTVALADVDAGRNRTMHAGIAVGIGHDVGHVTPVVDLAGHRTVVAAGRVEVATGAAAVRRTAVALLVDVETVLAARRQPLTWPIACSLPSTCMNSIVPCTWLSLVGCSVARASTWPWPASWLACSSPAGWVSAVAGAVTGALFDRGVVLRAARGQAKHAHGNQGSKGQAHGVSLLGRAGFNG